MTGNLLKASRAVAAALVLAMGSMHAAAQEAFFALTSLVLPDGATLVAGGFAPAGGGYSMAVKRLLPNGAGPDPAFGKDGIATIPVWRYYEFAGTLALQADGKIIVAGNAADSLVRSIPGPQCHPALCLYYPVVARLNPDGSLDKSFNGTGKIVLAIGDANDDPFYGVQDFGTLIGVSLDADGTIDVLVDDPSPPHAAVAARLLADGTLDRTFKSERAPIPREVTFARFQGLYWTSPSDVTWQLAIAQQGETLFGISFSYGDPSTPSWVSFAASKVGPNRYSGTIYETRGPAYDAVPFDSSLVTAREAGIATLEFDGDGGVDFTSQRDGVTHTRQLMRMQATAQPTCTSGAQPDLSLARNYDGMWWAAPPRSESGWGLQVTDQGGTLSVAWLTYAASGEPLWLASQALQRSNGDFTGDLIRVFPNASSPGDLTGEAYGTIALRFSDGNSGQFTYTIAGTTRAKPITRFVFEEFGTICSN